jgi:hypothetical protein
VERCAAVGTGPRRRLRGIAIQTRTAARANRRCTWHQSSPGSKDPSAGDDRTMAGRTSQRSPRTR